ncbi:hypothetical protein ABBQ38_008798 [Trebouxia sp. C0009 RCD-2024]
MPIARQADGLWVYLDSSEPEQRMPLKQLQQQHGHEVVGALLITAVQPKDDSCNVASRLPGRPPAAASTSIRSASVSIALPALSPVSTASPDVPATPRSVLTCYGCRLDFNTAGTILPLLVRQRARDVP